MLKLIKISLILNTGIAWLSSVRVEKRQVKSNSTNATHVNKMILKI